MEARIVVIVALASPKTLCMNASCFAGFNMDWDVAMGLSWWPDYTPLEDVEQRARHAPMRSRPPLARMRYHHVPLNWSMHTTGGVLTAIRERN
jgi:hypothetical protein